MLSRNTFQLKVLFHLIAIFLPLSIKANQENDLNNYFFTMYPSKGSKTPYIVHAYTPSSKHLIIDYSKSDIDNMIKEEASTDSANPNISSEFFYEDEYLVKTCYGLRKIVEIIPQKETMNENPNYIFPSDNSSDNINISNNFIYCYSTTINNPVTSNEDSKAIITYWVEKKSSKEYNHKCVLFFINTKKFSDVYTLYSSSSSSFNLENEYPTYCTTFRATDIFCSYYDSDLNNQFVIETNKIISNTKTNPSVYFVLSDFGQITGNDMKPVALNRELKSIFGGYYDVFLAEFHNNSKDKKSTVLLYSLYRKSLHASIVPMFANLELFFGTNVKGAYIPINLFNYILDTDEMLLLFVHQNKLQVVRVDYSVENNLFKDFADIQNLGNFTAKLTNCNVPKYMKSTYITNLIKYEPEDQLIVDNNKKYHYIYQQDVSVLLSCSNTNEGNEEISYNPIVIEMPQCLNYLDSTHGYGIHKINFYLSISVIIYDIYSDPRLKSFRNVGIMFYPYDRYYAGLLFLQIRLKSTNKFIVPQNNVIYNDITQIRFERIIPRYVPFFSKPFYLKYRLFNINKSTNSNIINEISSNLCSFQIKFFPYDVNYLPQPVETDLPTTTPVPETEQCTIPNCAICSKNENDYTCQECDTSEIEVLVLDDNKDSRTYGQCVCDSNLGFYKDLYKNMCQCQENYAYYKSTNLCWTLKKLKEGPYYVETIDDISGIPIYNDCYSSCKKCSKGGDENNHNCDECKEGYAYVDDDEGNCYNKEELIEGYHEVGPGHYIKCHENCISCADKPFYDEINNIVHQHCTHCRYNVSYFLRENPNDDFFNCFETKCDENVPSLLFAYSEKSYECFSNCNNGLQPYNNTKVCLLQCNNDYPYLDITTKKCYSSCEFNENNNKISDIDKGICTNECKENNNPNNNKCSVCQNDRLYQNKEGNCVPIPEQCLVVDINSGLCKICNTGYYPLKEDLDKGYFNCYGSIEDIINSTNKTNYYLNETEGYWDECYEACESCYGFGSENRQKCKKCKKNYHFKYYSNNNNTYNNCIIDLTPNENCTSTQIEMYIYKDFCHLCKEGYSFVNGTDKCMLTEELKNRPYYEREIKIKKGDNRTEEIEVKIFYPCYETCRTCKEKGDFYDNKCTSCINQYKFDKTIKTNCILSSNDEKYMIATDSPIGDEDTDNTSDEIIDSEENIWFKLGDESFYFYKHKYCLIIFYDKSIFLVSNKIDCINICKIWTKEQCELKKYTRFMNMPREEYDNLVDKAYDYDEIKDNVNIILNVPEKRLYFHLTNYVSPPPKNLSYIDISPYQSKIKKYFNANILLFKVDIKREDTKSTQVEYQFYNPNSIGEKVNLAKIISKRRLDNYNSSDNYNDDDKNVIQLKIDLPVDWSKEELEKIDYLYSQNIDAFNSSSEFYIDNCNQFTSSKGNDVFLKERKKQYYPDIPFCEKDCTFEGYNRDTEKVTCQCNYKKNSNNYKDVTFENNPVDEKFTEDLFFENLQSMKCFKVIFKWENLKENAGFIIMILFVIIFSVSFIFYYLSGGFTKIKNYTSKVLKEDKLSFIIDKSKDSKESNGEGEKRIPMGIEKIDVKPPNNGNNLFENPEDNEEEVKNKDNEENLIDDIDNDKGENKSVGDSGKDTEPKKSGGINDSDGVGNNAKGEYKKVGDSGKDTEPKKSGGINDSDGVGDNVKGGNKSVGDSGKDSEPKKIGGINDNSGVGDNVKGENKNPENPGEINGKEKSEEGRINLIDEEKKEKNPGDNNPTSNLPNNGNNEQAKDINNDNKSEDKNSLNKSLISKRSNPENQQNSENKKGEGEGEDPKNEQKNEQKNEKNEDEIKNIPKKDEKDEDKTKIEDKKNPENENNEEEVKKEDIEDDDDFKMTLNINEITNQKLENAKKDEKNNSNQNENNNNGDNNNNPQNNKNQNENNNGEDDKEDPKDLDIPIINENEKLNEKEKRRRRDPNHKRDFQDSEEKKQIDYSIDTNTEKENILIGDLNSEYSEINLPKANDNNKTSNNNNKNEKEKEKEIQLDKNKQLKRLNSDTSSFYAVNMKKDNDIYSLDSKIIKDTDSEASVHDNIYDLISQGSHISNPPKFGDKKKEKNLHLNEQSNEEEEQEQNVKNNQIIGNAVQDVNSKEIFNNRKDSDDKSSKKNNKNFFENLFKYNEMNNENINKVIEYNDELLNLKDFAEKYQTFRSIYLADLKKHHILYFSFCCDVNNMFLKLSLFSFTLSLYFAINTFLIFDSNMSDAYYDSTKTKPLYIVMNLLLPFLICDTISFIIKFIIMPQYYINKIIKKIQSNDKLKNIITSYKKGNKNEENNKKEEEEEKTKGKRRRTIKNQKKNLQKYELNNDQEYQDEKKKLEREFGLLYSSYLKKVIIYYAISFVILVFIWYMMTSFCAIFKNTGVKLILNSFISIFAGFLFPFILGLIPSGLGFLAIKLKIELIYRIYKFINIVI